MNLLQVLPAFACALTLAPLVADAAPARFPVPAGRVAYRLTGEGAASLSGNITMSWINSGARFRQDALLNVGGLQGLKTWTLFDGRSLFVAAPNLPGAGGAKVVRRVKLPPNVLNSIPGVGNLGGGVNPNAGKVVGRATLLGQPCVIRLVNTDSPQAKGRFKLWMWQNLPLRAEVDMNFKRPARAGRPARAVPPLRVTMAATSLNTTARPAASLFKLPSGVQIQDFQVPNQR